MHMLLFMKGKKQSLVRTMKKAAGKAPRHTQDDGQRTPLSEEENRRSANKHRKQGISTRTCRFGCVCSCVCCGLGVCVRVYLCTRQPCTCCRAHVFECKWRSSSTEMRVCVKHTTNNTQHSPTDTYRVQKGGQCVLSSSDHRVCARASSTCAHKLLMRTSVRGTRE